MAFGVTNSGFNIKRFTDVRASLVTRAAAKPSLSILDTDAETVFGEIIDIMGGEIADMWELALATSQLTNPEAVEGVLQDNNHSLVGVDRLEANPSSTFIRYKGDIGTVIPLTAAIGIPNTNIIFSPTVNSTLSLSDPISSIGITLSTGIAGTRSISIDGNTVSHVTGGTTDTTVLATAFANTINTDASVNSIVTATSDADVVTITADTGSYNFEYSNLSGALLTDTKAGKTLASNATTNGPNAANVGEVNQVVVSITGLDSAVNTTIAILGRLTETNEEFRSRRRTSLAIIGSGTIDSIVDNVAALDGVTRVTGVENTTITTDAEGRPGKSFEIIVTGGEDQAIADTIWRTKPTGVETYGNVNGGVGVNVIDTSGNTQRVEFSRPVERAQSLLVRYKIYSEESQPTNLQSALTSAVTTYAGTLIPGVDVIPQRYENAIFTSVSGLQQVEVYSIVSTDSTPPAAPTGLAAERNVVTIDAVQFVTLDAVNVSFEVIP